MDNDIDILNINIFTKLIKKTQDFSNFETYKTLFSYSSYFFIQEKKKIYPIII